MTTRDDQAHAYADAHVEGFAGADWMGPHGGPPKTGDVFTLVEDAFAAGWDAAVKQVTADLT